MSEAGASQQITGPNSTSAIQRIANAGFFFFTLVELQVDPQQKARIAGGSKAGHFNSLYGVNADSFPQP